jgi:HTH-type transcriptional regulator, competence development regulator
MWISSFLLVALERNEEVQPSSRTVYQTAQALKLPANKLMELAGLTDARDEGLGRAALRFAARSEPTARLSKEEREAFEEFVRVLVESSDGE